MKELPENLKNKIKKAEGDLAKEGLLIDTLIVKVEKDFFGYQPIKQPRVTKIVQISEERRKELKKVFNKACKYLEKNNIQILVCFAALKEGSATIYITELGVKLKEQTQQQLQKMEAHHAKVS